jgi:hypothetical protein
MGHGKEWGKRLEEIVSLGLFLRAGWGMCAVKFQVFSFKRQRRNLREL